VSGFHGFPPEAPAFLAALAANNDTGWFAAHKADFETLVQAPLRHLLSALSPSMLTIDPAFETDPRGGALSRVRRDTRFSRDKSPYRVTQWISFKRRGKAWPTRPTFFLEITPSTYRCGMGYFAASPATMNRLRDIVASGPDRLVAGMAAARAAGFDLEGTRYRRPRHPAGLPPEAEEWFNFKTLYLSRQRPIDPLLFSSALATDTETRFMALAPLYDLMLKADRPCEAGPV
jgi:uncharacterized protein (TIGR02453 family)